MLLLASLHLVLLWPALVAVELAPNEALRVVPILQPAFSSVFWVLSLVAQHHVASSRRTQVPALDMVGPVSWVEVVKHNYGPILNYLL